MARFTMSSFRPPLPPWHPRAISSLNCSVRTAMAPLTHTSSSLCAVSPSFHSSSSLPSRGVEVLRRSTRVRLMRFKAAGLSNLLGLRSPHLSPFHLRDGGRASGRLTCTRASSSSSACSGTFLYSLHTCWKRCYQNHITLSYACHAGQNLDSVYVILSSRQSFNEWLCWFLGRGS
jgi:hypothetical protein